MKNYTIIALLAATAISTSSPAFAEPTHVDNNDKAAVAAPAMPEGVPVTEPAPIQDGVMHTTMPSDEHAAAAPVSQVTEMPKADKAFVTKLNDFYNTKNIDGIMDMYSSNFISVCEKGVVKNAADKRKMLVDMFARPDFSANSVATADYIKDVAPGVAVFGIEVSMHSDPAKGEMKAYVTQTVKFEDGNWKIVSEHVSYKAPMMAEKDAHHEDSKKSGNLITIFAAVLGILAGFLGGKLLGNKKEGSN